MTLNSVARRACSTTTNRGVKTVKIQSLAAMARELPPVVYYIHTRDNLIKIGFTRDLAARKCHFGSGWTHILAVQPGTMADEKATHRMFSDLLERGREYFRPEKPLMDHINSLRGALGISPVDLAQVPEIAGSE